MLPVISVALTALGCDSTQPRPVLATLGVLQVSDAYIPASPNLDVASLYFTVANTGPTDDTLLTIHMAEGVASLHRVVTQNEATRMQPIESLRIPAHGEIRLLPGDHHVMVTDLNQAFEVDDTVTVELTFALAGTLRFPATVLTYTDVVRRLERTNTP